MIEDTRPFPPYDIPGPDGKPLQHEHVTGVPVIDNSRKLAKDIVKLAKLKAIPKLKRPKFKSDVKWY